MDGLHILGIFLIIWLAVYYIRLGSDMLQGVGYLREPREVAFDKWLFFPLTILMWGLLTWSVVLFCF